MVICASRVIWPSAVIGHWERGGQRSPRVHSDYSGRNYFVNIVVNYFDSNYCVYFVVNYSGIGVVHEQSS